MALSPFGDYETYIKKTDWDSYLANRGDRSSPVDLEAVKAMATSLVAEDIRKTTPKYTSKPDVTTMITHKKIDSAIGKRDQLPADLRSQGAIMGGSATKVFLPHQREIRNDLLMICPVDCVGVGMAESRATNSSLWQLARDRMLSGRGMSLFIPFPVLF